tara:strand:+ start:11069 stop:11488 length:420 start_codon:yes stop_codon:yes gene_type:complete
MKKQLAVAIINGLLIGSAAQFINEAIVIGWLTAFLVLFFFRLEALGVIAVERNILHPNELPAIVAFDLGDSIINLAKVESVKLLGGELKPRTHTGAKREWEAPPRIIVEMTGDDVVLQEYTLNSVAEEVLQKLKMRLGL